MNRFHASEPFRPPTRAPARDGPVCHLTLRQVTEECLLYKKDALKVSTYNQYRNQCCKHLLSRYGDVNFSCLTEEQLNDLLKRMVLEGYRISTVQNVRTILMMVIRYAEQNGIPCQITSPLYSPKRTKRRIQVFSVREQKQIEKLLYSYPDDYALAVFLSMYCGLRIGEVCALQWQDISFRNNTLIVSKTLSRIQDTGHSRTHIAIGSPKSHSSIRTIPIPAFLMPVLRRYRKQDTDYVITGTQYSMEPRTCLRRYKTILKKANVSNYSFHALRHTFATRCVETGMDIKSLSEILGHSAVHITLDLYVHPSMDFKRTQINRLRKVTTLHD